MTNTIRSSEDPARATQWQEFEVPRQYPRVAEYAPLSPDTDMANQYFIDALRTWLAKRSAARRVVSYAGEITESRIISRALPANQIWNKP